MADDELWPGKALRVVINDEEQYSIWPVDNSLPNGWHDTGISGSREHCLDHIQSVWTDMRPLSLRRAMAEHDSRAAPESGK